MSGPGNINKRAIGSRAKALPSVNIQVDKINNIMLLINAWQKFHTDKTYNYVSLLLLLSVEDKSVARKSIKKQSWAMNKQCAIINQSSYSKVSNHS